ncbi:biotin-dependent carboxyltransferase family protein [Methylocapsa sp. S129]|uniref:5-oxoprolinase subunit C family protein n=1 Tax=Methylocapsa sp. S129 TaxID=1641869 RepID=UPI00131B996C|nr:biotin-dependent carboxyltransferase family protein [Methylocapsa sp. S129]
MNAALRISAPGGAATIQDLGRPGFQRYGVPEAGAMDRGALRIANLLVGNDETEACIEFAVVGGAYEMVGGPGRLAVAGDFTVTVDGVKLAAYQSYDLREGSRLSIGRSASGVYGYLAVDGGLDIAAVLGSRSTHVRSGIGGGVLQAGMRLPLRQQRESFAVAQILPRASWPQYDGPIRVVLGPQDDFFTPKGIADFLAGDYRVSLRSDRMGYRLEGPPIARAGDFNIVSDGIALGSIQVPGTGLPIVLLADRQSTGGYPKIATVVSCDIRRLAQRRPQDVVRFAAVSADEAEEIAKADQAAFHGLCSHIRTAIDTDPYDSARLLQLNLVDGFIDGEV